MKTVLLGITSGIASYKILGLIPLLKKENINIEIIMSKSAAKMISPEEFEKINKKKVHIKLFEKDFNYRQILEKKEVEHISLADKCDLVCIAPATANTIAKLAHGLADDLLTTTILATTKPVLIFPSMNSNMWAHPATADNVKTLIKRGYIIISPDSGPLACGTSGMGRLPEIDLIKNEITACLQKKNKLQGKTILITSGPTEEPIDSVRVMTNKSSGKMGAAMADSCYLQGGRIILIRAKNSAASKYPVEQYVFTTSEDLRVLIKKHVYKANVCIHCAAVSDFIPQMKKGKISSFKKTTLDLIPQKKIVNQIKKWNSGLILIAFKAHYGLPEQKLLSCVRLLFEESKADYIIANDISKEGIGFESDYNQIKIINNKGRIINAEKDKKLEIAKIIISKTIIL